MDPGLVAAAFGNQLSACGSAKGFGGESVEVAQSPAGGLVQHGDGVGRERGGLSTGALETMSEVLSGVVDSGFAEV